MRFAPRFTAQPPRPRWLEPKRASSGASSKMASPNSYGIPYTAPPVGDLRWRPPKKHAAWAGVLKAEAFGSNCPQNQNHIFAGPANLVDEDCLFLNVFTPNLDPSARLPVIFWIHGGGNFEGESTDYDASKLASDGKTVVVTINYRLGSLAMARQSGPRRRRPSLRQLRSP